jgi:hypothetical protein
MSAANHDITATRALRLALVIAGAMTSVLAQAALPTPSGDTGQLTVYGDLGAFLAATQALGEPGHEDFEGGFTHYLPLMEFSACAEPVDSASNDACFAPGDLLDGIHIRSSRDWGVIAFNTGIFGLPDRAVAAWPYRLNPPPTLDFTIVDFDYPPTAIAADVYGLKIENGSANGDTVPVQIDAYAADASLIGSFTVQPASANVAAFAGFTSPVPVASVVYGTRIEVAAAPIDNLRFAGGAGIASAADTLDFGPVAVFDSATLPWQVTNEGHLDLVFGAAPLPAPPFAIVSNGCSGNTLAPGASCTVQFSFAPTWQDIFSQALEVSLASASTPVVLRLGGGGVLAVQSSSTGLGAKGGGQ